jgi:hypothetical protein
MIAPFPLSTSNRSLLCDSILSNLRVFDLLTPILPLKEMTADFTASVCRSFHILQRITWECKDPELSEQIDALIVGHLTFENLVHPVAHPMIDALTELSTGIAGLHVDHPLITGDCWLIQLRRVVA